jgi:tRNA(fMet)-specific endonuclease VapC
MYALDTNTLIYFFKGLGRVGENLLAAQPRDVAIPAVVLYELEVGLAKSTSPAKRRRQLAALLATVSVLPLAAAEAAAAARVRATLEVAGTPISIIDTLIAGTALAHRATLVTHNVAEFGRVDGLHVVDWY